MENAWFWGFLRTNCQIARNGANADSHTSSLSCTVIFCASFEHKKMSGHLRSRSYDVISAERYECKPCEFTNIDLLYVKLISSNGCNTLMQVISCQGHTKVTLGHVIPFMSPQVKKLWRHKRQMVRMETMWVHQWKTDLDQWCKTLLQVIPRQGHTKVTLGHVNPFMSPQVKELWRHERQKVRT